MRVLLLLALLFFSRLPLAMSPWSELSSASSPGINVLSRGAKGDGLTNDSPAIQRLISRNRTTSLYFPPGTYILHNRGNNNPGLTFRGFSGTIRMAKGAEFACDTVDATAGQCVWIIDSRAVTLDQVTITYRDFAKLPVPRNAAIANALLIENSSNITLVNTTILGSTGSGIWNTDSDRITYAGKTSISNTSADGIHFENVGGSSLSDLYTEETGDDALGVTNIAKTNPKCGLKAIGIHIHNSHSRGIATAGGCNASFENIVVDGTANSGIAATQDNFIGSRASMHITFSQAEIKGAGAIDGIRGDAHCIDIGGSQFVAVSNVTCSGLKEGGAFIYGNASNVIVQNVTLSGPLGNGFQSSNASYVSLLNDRVTYTSGNGFDIEVTSHATLHDCRTDDAGGYGFFHSRSSDVTETSLTSRNSASKIGGNNRAWWAEYMRGPIAVDGLTVIDDQRRATGYVVGDYANPEHSVILNNIAFQLAHGMQSIETNGDRSSYHVAGIGTH
jgi:Pectate lyase superfamily protein/Right handed beta helix region